MSNTTRIAKNTIFLYFRQILIMLVSLYTVRVVLNVLGAEDYGIYNVVAGVVVMFSFVNNAMASGTQRFLNFYLGKKDNQKTQETFSASLGIHFFVAIIFVIAAETVGLWFVNAKLNIPPVRHDAAMVVYQISVVTTVFNILRVPYNAVIIAYEKMSFFASISIVEAILKLVVVFLLSATGFDKLIFYAFLLLGVSIIIMFAYKIFCNKKFETAHFISVKDKKLVKEILSFSMWSLFGATANVANSQGTNIVLNMFTNVTVNAAMGIANQVNAAVYSFVSNFQTAFNPQIIKSWAEGEKEYFINLIIRTAKISFLLLNFIAVPLIINAEFVLEIWLKNVPDYSVIFVQLIILCSLVDSWNGPLWMSIQATGKIKKYQIIISVLIFLNLPLSIIAFYLGFSGESILIIRLAILVINTFWRIFFLHGRVGLPRFKFICNVIGRCCLVFALGYISTSFIGMFIGNETANFFITCGFSVLINLFLSAFVALSQSERNSVLTVIKNKVNKGKCSE